MTAAYDWFCTNCERKGISPRPIYFHHCSGRPRASGRFDFSIEEVNEHDRATWAAQLFEKETDDDA